MAWQVTASQKAPEVHVSDFQAIAKCTQATVQHPKIMSAMMDSKWWRYTAKIQSSANTTTLLVHCKAI